MRISLLQKREPFGQILEKTLSPFLHDRFGKSFHVKWHEGLISLKYSPRVQIWLCNAYINAIFVPGIKRIVLFPVIQEFSYSTILWRRPLQNLYVRLATNRKLSFLFARSRLEISPPINQPENLLILGGNHHIRFHDYSKKKAFVIGKAGFDAKLIERDICVREKYPFLPSPKILDKSSNGKWYSEELILGTPVNRIMGKKKPWEVIRNIQKQISHLYKETAMNEDIVEYTGNLFNKFIAKREKPFLDGKIYNRTVVAGKTIVNYISNEFKGYKVVTVQSHGDFQPANILVSSSKNWLIDWEYADRRQVAYDPLVLVLNSRFPSSLNRRIRDALSGKMGASEVKFLLEFPFIEWHNEKIRSMQIALFLLEDLCLKIQENDNVLFRKINLGLTVYLNEMEKALDAF